MGCCCFLQLVLAAIVESLGNVAAVVIGVAVGVVIDVAAGVVGGVVAGVVVFVDSVVCSSHDIGQDIYR